MSHAHSPACASPLGLLQAAGTNRCFCPVPGSRQEQPLHPSCALESSEPARPSEPAPPGSPPFRNQFGVQYVPVWPVPGLSRLRAGIVTLTQLLPPGLAGPCRHLCSLPRPRQPDVKRDTALSQGRRGPQAVLALGAVGPSSAAALSPALLGPALHPCCPGWG